MVCSLVFLRLLRMSWRIPQVLDTLVGRWYTDAFVAARRDIVQRRLKQVVDTDADVFMNVFRIYAGTELMPWLHEVEAR